MQLEAARSQRLAQIVFHAHAPHGEEIEFGGKELYVVAALGLGVIHRRVGVPHQRAAVLAVDGVEGDADARRDVDLVAVDQVGLPKGDEHLFGHAGGVRRIVDFGKDDHEFVAAQPGEDVAAADRRLQSIGHVDQQRISGGVAERVVGRLEPIEVEEQHGERMTFALCRRQRLFEALGEAAAVEQPGQRVVMRHVVDVRLGGLAFPDVAARTETTAIGQQAGIELDRDGLSVHGDQVELLPQFARFQQFLEAELDGGMFGFEGDVQNAPPDQFLRAVSEQAQRLLIGVLIASLVIGDENRVGRAFEYALEARFALLQQGFGQLALGDVAPDAVDDRSALMMDGRQRDFREEVGAIHLAMHPFETVQPVFHGEGHHAFGLGEGILSVGLLRRREARGVAVQQIVARRIAEKAYRRRIAFDETIPLDDPGRIRGGFEQLLEPVAIAIDKVIGHVPHNEIEMRNEKQWSLRS